MIIRYFAMLRQVTGTSEEKRDATAGTIGALLESLSAEYGPEFRKWVSDEDGNWGGLSIIIINGVDYRHLGGLDAPVKGEDVVAIFPPVAGG